jgi:hypothetical protein
MEEKALFRMIVHRFQEKRTTPLSDGKMPITCRKRCMGETGSGVSFGKKLRVYGARRIA